MSGLKLPMMTQLPVGHDYCSLATMFDLVFCATVAEKLTFSSSWDLSMLIEVCGEHRFCYRFSWLVSVPYWIPAVTEQRNVGTQRHVSIFTQQRCQAEVGVLENLETKEAQVCRQATTYPPNSRSGGFNPEFRDR